MSVLFVDDEIIALMSYEITFRDSCEVVTAQNGLEALRILEEDDNIKLIFSDMKMPEMTGIEFIHEAFKKYPDINYYILTGYNITEPIKKAIQNGFVKKYFGKPLNIGEIKAEIKSFG